MCNEYYCLSSHLVADILFSVISTIVLLFNPPSYSRHVSVSVRLSSAICVPIWRWWQTRMRRSWHFLSSHLSNENSGATLGCSALLVTRRRPIRTLDSSHVTQRQPITDGGTNWTICRQLSWPHTRLVKKGNKINETSWTGKLKKTRNEQKPCSLFSPKDHYGNRHLASYLPGWIWPETTIFI